MDETMNVMETAMDTAVDTIETIDDVCTELVPTEENEDCVTTIILPTEEKSSTGETVAAVVGVAALAVGSGFAAKKFIDSRLDKIITGEKETNSVVLTGLAAMRAKSLEKKAAKKAGKEAKKNLQDTQKTDEEVPHLDEKDVEMVSDDK